MSLLKAAFKELTENPSDDFIRLILNEGVYDGIKNQKVVEKFKPLVKRAVNQYINEKMSNKFKGTLSISELDEKKQEEPTNENDE